MDLLLLRPTNVTPGIRLNSKKRLLYFKGRSSPENALQFYDQVMKGIDRYFEKIDALRVVFIFEYFNTSSSKCIFEIFRKLQSHKANGKKIRIDWVYEEGDDDMMETGEDFADIIGMKIHFKEVESLEEIAA